MHFHETVYMASKWPYQEPCWFSGHNVKGQGHIITLTFFCFRTVIKKIMHTFFTKRGAHLLHDIIRALLIFRAQGQRSRSQGRIEFHQSHHTFILYDDSKKSSISFTKTVYTAREWSFKEPFCLSGRKVKGQSHWEMMHDLEMLTCFMPVLLIATIKWQIWGGH